MTEKINSALVFVKPHAVTDSTIGLVQSALKDNKITILADGEVMAETIDKDRIIDRHYATIARYATEWGADKITISEAAAKQFSDKFGLTWADAINDKKIMNAAEATKALGDITAEELTQKWGAGQRLKLAPGLYVCLYKEGMFVINGFYLRNRQKFTVPGTKIHWYTVQWAEADLTWADFRAKIIGPTDPADAPENSLRGIVKRDWESLGLSEVPNVADNGIHASAGPLEGLAERMVWLSSSLSSDAFTVAAVAAGATESTLLDFVGNPVVTLDGQTAPVFDILEDKQTSDVVKLVASYKA